MKLPALKYRAIDFDTFECISPNPVIPGAFELELYMERLIQIIEQISEQSGKAISYLNTALVWIICLDVIMRYFFNFSLIWMIELETYVFAMIFLIGSAYTFKHDKHVRVDVFYSKFSPKRKAWVNFLGGILFLIPWSAIIVMISYEFAARSFAIGENSPQPGGLPALYILKFMITLGFFLLLLQAIASVMKAFLSLRNPATAN